MVLFEPGTMRVDGADHKLPGWLIPQYKQVFAESLLTLVLMWDPDEDPFLS